MKLTEFKSDGCSGGMSWFYKKVLKKLPPWEEICVEHDKVYHEGGTAIQRLIADIDMMIGVIYKGYPTIAILMFLGVRLGGMPIFPFSWRWGFGRSYIKSFWYDKTGVTDDTIN